MTTFTWLIFSDDDGNPFFAKSRDPCEQSGSRPATSCNNKKGNTADEPVDSKTLFGDSDDSDWDDLAGGLFQEIVYYFIKFNSGFLLVYDGVLRLCW
jgi:hypothetical protein